MMISQERPHKLINYCNSGVQITIVYIMASFHGLQQCTFAYIVHIGLTAPLLLPYSSNSEFFFFRLPSCFVLKLTSILRSMRYTYKHGNNNSKLNVSCSFYMQEIGFFEWPHYVDVPVDKQIEFLSSFLKPLCHKVK